MKPSLPSFVKTQNWQPPISGKSLKKTTARVFLIALRHLAKAHGIAKVAKAAGVERESLYRSLSANGNPRLSTLLAVVKAIGVKLTVEDA